MYLWMEHGGIYAVANLRGGSEFGEIGIVPACSRKTERV